MNARGIQSIALAISITCAAVGGQVLPKLLSRAETDGLRYTFVSVDGAPPWVAVGTAIGALRGLVVNMLWIKVNYQKEAGLYHEVMADADLITKLQPRFASVWAFHGHNMAYNISVATSTEAERWEWVKAGIRLVRNEGLRKNPNDLELHRELAFWFAHKIGGTADDAHLYYKTEFAREWHYLLGAPADSWEDRRLAVEAIATAPETLDEAETRTPGVLALIERFDTAMGPFREVAGFAPSVNWLSRYGEWQAVTTDTEVAEILGIRDQWRETRETFAGFDDVASDPAVAEQWETLVAFVRRQVLEDDYNMDPRVMLALVEEIGPIDWRSPFAHALYWSRLGERRAGISASDVNQIYITLNNDRQQLQSIQGLARHGRIIFDPFSPEMPSRFPEPRFVDTIERMFAHYYEKHYETRGGGGETFINFLQNFMGGAVREAYRSGEFDRAQRLLGQLDARFGSGASPGLQNLKYALPLEAFVKSEIEDEYTYQAHMGPSEAMASMRYAYRVGVGRDREEVWENALVFIGQVIAIFKQNDYYDYVNRFGRGRMAELLTDLPTAVREGFRVVMTDPGIPIQERVTIWSKVDKFRPELRAYVYDDIIADLRRQLQRHPLGAKYSAAELFPPPPNLQLIRQRLAAEQAARQAEADAQRQRDDFQNR